MKTTISSYKNKFIILIAPEAVWIFAPEQYRGAIWVIPSLAMANLFVFSYNQFSYFQFYYEKTKLIALATLMAALANLGLNYVLIRQFGYVAA